MSNSFTILTALSHQHADFMRDNPEFVSADNIMYHEFYFRRCRRNVQPLPLCVQYSSVPADNQSLVLWINFEIGDMNFWRGAADVKFFDHFEYLHQNGPD